MGAMAFGVPWGSGFVRFVHGFSEVGFVSVEISSGADDFPVTSGSGKVARGHALPFPCFRDRAQTRVRETRAFGPNPGVKNSDYDVVRVVGVGPEAKVVGEAQEVVGASGVELARQVGNNGEDGRVISKRGDLGGGERGGEAMDRA